jgi:hypothetical protein
MFDKFLKKTSSQLEQTVVFPNTTLVATNNSTVLPLVDEKADLSIKRSELNLSGAEIIDYILKDSNFMQYLEENLIAKLLMRLEAKYGFEPTDKYKEEIVKKRQYVSQLDAYLEERRVINQAVETDLQHFLNNTTLSLTQALENFSREISDRIKEAEGRHGIDMVRQAVLNTERQSSDEI